LQHIRNRNAKIISKKNASIPAKKVDCTLERYLEKGRVEEEKCICHPCRELEEKGGVTARHTDEGKTLGMERGRGSEGCRMLSQEMPIP